MESNNLKVLFCSIMAFLCLAQTVTAQETVNKDNFYVAKADFLRKIALADSLNLSENNKEDGLTARYLRWEWLWRNRLGKDGNMNTANEMMAKHLDDGDDKLCDSPYDNAINWTNLGPFNSRGSLGPNGGSATCLTVADIQNQGRVESISVNPKEPNDIVIGSWNSGIWRTTNGGKIWVNTTDDEGFSYFGIVSMVRHPLDEKIIYAATLEQKGITGIPKEGYMVFLLLCQKMVV